MGSQWRRNGDLHSESIKRIYLCRHGETAWTLSGQHTSRTDLPLTENGKKQALFLRQKLQGIACDLILTSPRKRALQTCEGMGAQINEDLVEWDYGRYEGLSTEEVRRRFGPWDIFKEGAPEGETPAQVALRADRVLQSIAKYKGNVALFSHGHFLRVLAARFLGLEAEMGKLFTLSVASLSILGYEREQPAIFLWNEP